MNPADVIHKMGGRWPEAPREQFIASRYPHTYAYDFMRECKLANSRGEAAGVLRAHFPSEGIREVARRSLADAYLIHYNIHRPTRDAC